MASFFRIQSMIRDDGHRTLLFDLDNVIQRLNQDLPGHPSAVQLTGVDHNLLRRWAESMKGEHVRSACQRVLAAQKRGARIDQEQSAIRLQESRSLAI